MITTDFPTKQFILCVVEAEIVGSRIVEGRIVADRIVVNLNRNFAVNLGMAKLKINLALMIVENQVEGTSWLDELGQIIWLK